MVWTSDLDGPLGTGASVLATNLQPGTQTITLAVTDSLGARAAASAGVIVSQELAACQQHGADVEAQLAASPGARQQRRCFDADS